MRPNRSSVVPQVFFIKLLISCIIFIAQPGGGAKEGGGSKAGKRKHSDDVPADGSVDPGTVGAVDEPDAKRARGAADEEVMVNDNHFLREQGKPPVPITDPVLKKLRQRKVKPMLWVSDDRFVKTVGLL
jgi:hypothetical protein